MHNCKSAAERQARTGRFFRGRSVSCIYVSWLPGTHTINPPLIGLSAYTMIDKDINALAAASFCLIGAMHPNPSPALNLTQQEPNSPLTPRSALIRSSGRGKVVAVLAGPSTPGVQGRHLVNVIVILRSVVTGAI